MLKVKDIRGMAYLGKLNPTKLQHSVHVGPSGPESGERARMEPGIKGLSIYTMLRGLNFLLFTFTAVL